jgi:hypothetical protein
MKVQHIQEGLNLNVTHQFLVYIDGVNLTSKNINATKENAEAHLDKNREVWK